MRQYDTYTTSPVKKTTYVIIEVENNKSLQFQINWLNIERDRCVKARRKIHPKILNFLTEFRQPLQVQNHLEMPGILVQLGHIQHT